MGSHNNFIGRSGLQNICLVVPVCLIKSGSRIHQNYINDDLFLSWQTDIRYWGLDIITDTGDLAVCCHKTLVGVRWRPHQTLHSAETLSVATSLGKYDQLVCCIAHRVRVWPSLQGCRVERVLRTYQYLQRSLTKLVVLVLSQLAMMLQ